ncbi:hypothetical protein [Streptomyces sp. NPDC014006]|uniref:hypothetical protein n=1 Tax=Streptomyces sp. NPDC014006 TaxID=3364870 RepID=UPI0036FD1ACB
MDPRGHSIAKRPVMILLFAAIIALLAAIIALLAAIIIYLVRMWISDIAILLGLESNTGLERARAIDGGHPPGEKPYVEPRDARKL